MSNRKSLAELKELILMDIESQETNIKSFEGNENPQVKEMCNEANIRLKAMQDVLEYITDGSKYQFQKEDK